MRKFLYLKSVIIFIWFSLNSFGQESIAESKNFESIWKLEKPITIISEDKPTQFKIDLPSFKKEKGKVLCMRFKAYLTHPGPGGWGSYLAISLNGKYLDRTTETGENRLLNRPGTFKSTIGEREWWGVQFSIPNVVVFFGDGQILDQRVISCKEEGYLYLINISDYANYLEIGPDERVESAKKNELIFINTYLKKYIPTKEINLVIENLEIGYLPESFVRKISGGILEEYKDFKEKFNLIMKNYKVRIGENGVMEIDINGEKYQISSFFSFPGVKIGYNGFSVEKIGEENWQVETSKSGKNELKLEAEGKNYKIIRILKFNTEKINVEDIFENKLSTEIGVMIEHEILTPDVPHYYRISGVEKVEYLNGIAENPTIFVSQNKSSLGFLAEDNVLRLQGEVKKRNNTFKYFTRHFGLDKGNKYNFRFSIYPVKNKGPKRSNDYFAFINKIRNDWDVNFTVEGPYIFGTGVIPERKVKGQIIWPWLSTLELNPETGKLYKMDELEKILKTHYEKVKKANPEIQVLGVIESNLVPIDKRDIENGEDIGKGTHDYGTILSKEESEKLSKAIANYNDSILRTEDGRIIVDTYYPYASKKEFLLYLFVYYVEGNYRYKEMLSYMDFLFNKIGCDGVYMDQFTLSWQGLGLARDRCTYDKWDGYTVDIDENTGKITRKYTDCGLVSIKARKKILEYAVSKGKVVVINGFPPVLEEQNLRNVFRFAELENDYPNPLNYLNDEPPTLKWCGKGHLSTPIILGLRPQRLPDGEKYYAEAIMKSVITALKNGLLYYPNGAGGATIPKEGPGSGEYGALNHMFPITPIEINEGYIIGKERIISCISGIFYFDREPKVYLFDLKGKEKPVNFKINKKEKLWEVNVKINDWNEIVIIE